MLASGGSAAGAPLPPGAGAAGAGAGGVEAPEANQPPQSHPIGFSQGASLPDSYDPVWDFAYAYFPRNSSVVMFGGSPRDLSNHWSNQTWIYRKGRWSKGPEAPAGLTPRGGAAMAFDPAIKKIVLFGGAGADWPPYNDTWLFDGTSWTPGPIAPAGLSGRTGAEMAYDPGSHRLIMFGGSGVAPFNETWLFNGKVWTQGTTPADMASRQFFGMTYDESLQSVVVAGGSGYPDIWIYNGASWMRGPNLPSDMAKERFGLAYDPQLGGDVYFSGLGPAQADTSMWLLQAGQWVRVKDWLLAGWPEDRVDGGIVWNPREGALMLFAGILDDFTGGMTGLTDTWFFTDIAPQPAAVTLSPPDADMSTAIKLAVGTVQNGYGPVQATYRWLVNGQVLPGQESVKLSPGPYHPEDQITAQVRLTDSLNLVGPWVSSDPLMVVDRPPSLQRVTIRPTAPTTTSTMTAEPGAISDPDAGDTVTINYVWQVNAQQVASDTDVLNSSHFGAGDLIRVVATPVDSHGVAGAPVTSAEVRVRWNIDAGSGAPGTSVPLVKGDGFGPSEQVEIHLDAPTEPLLTTATTDGSGSFKTTVRLPSPLPGGTHMLYGVGRVSGITGMGPVTVIPGGSLNPISVAAGDTTTLTAVGFVPGENVSARFPGGDTITSEADGNGTAAIALVSPPEPAPGDRVTASAGSGTARVSYKTAARLTTVDSAAPYTTVRVTVTGMQSREHVTASLDASPIQTSTADAFGSLDTDVPVATTFGKHELAMAGQESGIQLTGKIDFPATIQLSRDGGPIGTVVQINSGPGWSPNSVVHLTWRANTPIADLTADDRGAVAYEWTVPSRAPGEVAVNLVDDVLKIKVSTTFTITLSEGIK
jgi:hypothetical protein